MLTDCSGITPPHWETLYHPALSPQHCTAQAGVEEEEEEEGGRWQERRGRGGFGSGGGGGGGEM